MRQKQAVGMGMDPAGDAYKSFVLTGKLPREDQQSLTSTDKKAILEADDMVSSNASAIDALGQAKSLSPKANSGWFAGTRASLANNLPDWLVPDFISSPEGGEATANLDNAVIANAVTQLKTIFGGNPTEGERKILLDLQGSSNQPDNVRQGIYGRAKAAAEKRLAFNKQRASELRGGTYYKPDGGISGASGVSQSPPDSASPPAPDEAVAELMANPTPEMQTHFDEVFGPGAAQAALNAKRAP